MSATVAQKMRNLDKANVVRFGRADLKREIRADPSKLLEVLADPPACVGTMPVGELLQQLPYMGRVRVGRLLGRSDVGLPWAKAIGALTERQRRVLAAQFVELREAA